MHRIIVVAAAQWTLLAAVGCSTATPATDGLLGNSCIDQDAANPTMTQVFEGARDAMIDGLTDPAEIEQMRGALAPDTQQENMQRSSPETYSTMATIVAEMPPGGYGAYVRAACDSEKEWDQSLDNSGVRWAMAWDGITVCTLIIGLPKDQRDAYVEAQAKAPARLETEAAGAIQRGEVMARAARKHMCPQ